MANSRYHCLFHFLCVCYISLAAVHCCFRMFYCLFVFILFRSIMCKIHRICMFYSSVIDNFTKLNVEGALYMSKVAALSGHLWETITSSWKQQSSCNCQSLLGVYKGSFWRSFSLFTSIFITLQSFKLKIVYSFLVKMPKYEPLIWCKPTQWGITK